MKMHAFPALLCLCLLGCSTLGTPAPASPEAKPVSLKGFQDGIHHWQDRHGPDYPRYEPAQFMAIADNLLLYQRLHGGWIENQDPTRILDASERARLLDEKSHATASFDNRNIYTQIEYLAEVYQRSRQERYRDALLRGLDFTLRHQNQTCGAWPHTVPGNKNYHRYITIADEVSSGVLRMLRKIAQGQSPFDFIDATTRARAGSALQRGDACMLRLQVRQQGQLTGWAGQYDPETLAPAEGRGFELAAIVSQETVEMLRYLMSIEQPSPAQIEAIESAVRWLERSAIKGWRLENFPLEYPVRFRYHTATSDPRLLADPTAPALWGRFYDLKDNSIILANHDGKRVASYAEISLERRSGYGWYGRWPSRLLSKEYPGWCARQQRPSVLVNP